MNRLAWVATALACLSIAPLPARAHEPMSLPELLAAFGISLDEVEIRDEKVADGLYVLFGAGGNIAASIGDDGVLIVDDQFPELIPQILAKIRKLGGGEVDYAINTHWHFDHAEGNRTLGKSNETRLISHASSRAMMRSDHVVNLVRMAYLQTAYPEHALPDITFDSRMQIHFNGETVELVHAGPAHTTGDAAVIFRGRNAVHMGDVYNNSGYPFIDADNGGSVDGIIAFCEAVLAELNPRTVVIPGHGPVTTYERMVDYVAMMKTIRDRIAALIADGASLEEVVAAKPTADWDDDQGDPTMVIDRVYHSLRSARTP